VFYRARVKNNKKLSYRRETARQLPTWRGIDRPSAHSPYAPSGYSYAYGRIRNPQQTYVKQAHFKINRAFKVIRGHPYWCRQESTTVCCRNCVIHADVISQAHEDYGNGKTANSSISTTPLKFDDVPARNTFEYLQMIYIARN